MSAYTFSVLFPHMAKYMWLYLVLMQDKVSVIIFLNGKKKFINKKKHLFHERGEALSNYNARI